MSLSDVLKPFAALSAEDVAAALTRAGCAPKAGATGEELLRLVSVEVLAIGVEDLLQKASEGTRALLGGKAAEDEESRAKKDIVAYLEGLPSAAVRQLAAEAGIKTDEAEAELLRVRLFEETVLLGAEGFLDLQDEALLATLRAKVGAKSGAAGVSKERVVEAIMVKMFNLKEREPAAKKAKPAFASKSEVAKLRVAELKVYCEENGLPSAGLKAELVERIWAAIKN